MLCRKVLSSLSFSRFFRNSARAASNSSQLALPYSSKTVKNDQILLKPHFHLYKIPATFSVPMIVNLFNHWLRVEEDRRKEAELITNMCQISALIIDDIQDDSNQRRGLPTTHKVHGVASSINSAVYAYFVAFEKILHWNNVEALEMFNHCLLELHRGLGLDVHYRENYICPTEEKYEEMASKKGATLLLLAWTLLKPWSGNKTDFWPLIQKIGLYSQLMNDYDGLTKQDYMEDKCFCEDVTEGKFSFPIIHAIHSNPEDSEVLDILKKHTQDRKLKEYFLKLLEKYGSIEYTKHKIQKLECDILNEVETLGGNPYIKANLDHSYAT